MIDPLRPYNRIEIDILFTKIKTQLHQDALLKGNNGKAQFKDCYTGDNLLGGDRYDYEHIRSSESIFMMYRDKLTNNEIAEVVNCSGNVAVTLRSINQSKGKMKMEDWISNSKNILKHKINIKLTQKTLSNADKKINEKVEEILSR
ncbi:hypothetical protein [Algibacter sp. 2305UL17-15]|uniref:hypothetical protein n=1 Tax=Algibacter sp. 2305UL17-15 TaxID=3231268 RepID=UPI00345AF9B8